MTTSPAGFVGFDVEPISLGVRHLFSAAEAQRVLGIRRPIDR